MAFSSQRALSDGTLSDIELTIEYIDRVDLKLFVDSVQIEDTAYTYEFITDNLIRITPDVTAGEEVLIQRQTRLESVLNVYADGAVFNNASMDENFRQMLLIAQEAREGATLEEIFNDLNMHGYSIRNLSNGVGPLDAVNKQQLDGVVSAAAAAAAVQAGIAAGHASAASASATLSQRWASEAEDVPVSGGLFSARHWAAKSEGFADEAALAADDAEAAALVSQNNQVPLCGVIWWPTRSFIPGGFIAGDGVLVSRASFPSLWALVQSGALPSVSDATWLADPAQRGKYSTGDGSTTFRVPDYNGKAAGSLGAVFLRGDGALSAAVAGVIQQDAFQGHDHATAWFDAAEATGGVFRAGVISGATGKAPVGTRAPAGTFANVGGNGNNNAGVLAPTGGMYSDGVNGTPRTASETRPLNVTGCHIIKAFGTAIDPGAVDVAQLAADVVSLTGRVQTLEARKNTLTYRSGNQTMGNQLLLTFPHGLGGEPDELVLGAQSLVAGGGYAVGDRIRLSPGAGISGVTGIQPAMWADSTNVYVRCSANGFPYLTKAGDGALTLTNSSWAAFVRATRHI